MIEKFLSFFLNVVNLLIWQNIERAEKFLRKRIKIIIRVILRFTYD